MSEFKKEIVTVDIDGEIISQDVYVDSESGLDIDPHSGIFRSRADTIAYIKEVYLVGKDSMRSELDRYNKWMKSGNKKEDPLMPSAGAILKKVRPPSEPAGSSSNKITTAGSLSDLSHIDQQCSNWKNQANGYFADKKYHYALCLYGRIEAALGKYLLVREVKKDINQQLYTVTSGFDALPVTSSTIDAIPSLELPDETHPRHPNIFAIEEIRAHLPRTVRQAQDIVPSKLTIQADTAARRSFLSICFSNSAEAHLRLVRPLEAFRCAEMAERLDDTNIKARYRQAAAALSFGQLLPRRSTVLFACLPPTPSINANSSKNNTVLVGPSLRQRWLEEGLKACSDAASMMDESTPPTVVDQITALERQLITAVEEDDTSATGGEEGNKEALAKGNLLDDRFTDLFGYF